MSDEFTVAKAQFFGGGINVDKASTKMNVVTPEYHDPETRSRELTETSVIRSEVIPPPVVVVPDPPPAGPKPTLYITASNQSRCSSDPIVNYTGGQADVGRTYLVQGLTGSDYVMSVRIDVTGTSPMTSVGEHIINVSEASVNGRDHYGEIKYVAGTLYVTQCQPNTPAPVAPPVVNPPPPPVVPAIKPTIYITAMNRSRCASDPLDAAHGVWGGERSDLGKSYTVQGLMGSDYVMQVQFAVTGGGGAPYTTPCTAVIQPHTALIWNRGAYADTIVYTNGTMEVIQCGSPGTGLPTTPPQPAPVTHPPYGTLLNTMCTTGNTKQGRYANGLGGTYDAVIEYNSVTCGFIAAPVIPPGPANPVGGTVLKVYCKGVDQWKSYANGNGGAVDAVSEYNSAACGYVAPVPPPVLPPNGGGGTAPIGGGTTPPAAGGGTKPAGCGSTLAGTGGLVSSFGGGFASVGPGTFAEAFTVTKNCSATAAQVSGVVGCTTRGPVSMAIYSMSSQGPGGELGFVDTVYGWPSGGMAKFPQKIPLQANTQYALVAVNGQGPAYNAVSGGLHDGSNFVIPGRAYTKMGYQWVSSTNHASMSLELEICPTAAGTCYTGYDPLAQSFQFESDCFLTGFDTFFETVDPDGGDIFFQIRTMENGFPTDKILAEKFVHPDQIAPFVSTDGSKGFRASFTHPIYIKGNEDYCFVVGGFSPNTRVWVARLGEARVDQPASIVENVPGKGVSFRSQNASTWTIEGAEDLKYNLWVALFEGNQMSLQFKAEVTAEKLSVDPFECEAGINKVRVYIDDHGLTSGDLVALSMFSTHNYRLTLATPEVGARPVIGQTIYSNHPDGTEAVATIHNVIPMGNMYEVYFRELRGMFREGGVFVIDTFDIKTAAGGIFETIPGFSGIISNCPDSSMSGVDLIELNKVVTVSYADSKDTFLVDITSTPTESGRFGGLGVFATPNYRYEIFNVTGESQVHGGQSIWTIEGIHHNIDGGPFGNNYAPADQKTISLGVDYHLDAPLKIVSTENEKDKNVNGVLVKAVLTTDKSTRLTPVVNIESFSLTTISNRVDIEDQRVHTDWPSTVGRFTPETDPALGSHAYKYVTRLVTLAKPAMDLKIMFDAYKDYNADFDIYVKTQAQYNTDDIDEYPWQHVSVVKPHSVNLEDRIDYDINCSHLTSDWKESFISFKVKLVGRTSNPAKPPLFKNLRIIALT